MPSEDSTTSALSRLPPPAIPTQIGPYRILEMLGEGGMGAVFKAEQRSPVKRVVALKLIRPGFDSAEVIARFQSERQALARMDHPNVAKVLDAGADEMGRPYFVMEYVPGSAITKFADDNKLTIPQRLEIFIQVCEAISHAHTKAIIHRDIKSSNVLAYLADGKPIAKVIDFGVAKALTGERLTDRTFNTARGEAIGTYESMSPEQADGSPDIDTRTDVYSLGVLLYELLTGFKPFDKVSFAQAADHEIRRIIREVDPPRPSTKLSSLGQIGTRIAIARRAHLQALTRQLRSELEWIPLMAMRKERDRRYASPLEIVADIRNYLQERPLRAGPESATYRFRKYLARNAPALSALAAILLLLVAGAVISVVLALRAHRAEKTVALQLTQVEREKKRADDETANLRREFSEHYVGEGIAAWDQPNPTVAALWFARALKFDEGDPQRSRLQRIRIGASLGFAARLLDISAPLPDALNVNSGRRIEINGNSAQIIEIISGSPLTTPMLHKDRISRANFSPDGKMLLTASLDRTVQVWDSTSGQPIGPPLQHSKAANYALFSPDSQLVATAGGDGTARVWNAKTGAQVASMPHSKTYLLHVSFSPDGASLVTAGGDFNARIWDVKSGKPLTEPMKHGGLVSRGCFSPDGRLVATSSTDHTVRIWDANTGRAILPPMPHPAQPVDIYFTNHGTALLTRAVDGTLRVWELSPTISATPPLQHGHFVHHASFSPDGSSILTTSHDHTASIWDANTGKMRSSMHHSGPVYHAAFSPDGRYVVTAGSGAQVWDRNGTNLLSLNSGKTTFDAAFSPDGTRIATASHDLNARIWDAKTGAQLLLLKHSEPVRHAFFNHDGRQVLTCSYDNFACIWDALTGAPLVRISHPSDIEYAAWSPDEKLLVTASSDWTAGVWDRVTVARLARLEHRAVVFHAEFSPDSRSVATASFDSTARIWDARTGRPLTPPMQHGGQLHHARFSSNGRYLLTASDDGSARLWDVESGKPLSPPLTHLAAVYDATFSPDSASFVTASDDHTARIWQLPSFSYSPHQAEQLAQLLSAHRIDGTTGIVPLTSSEWNDLWDSLRRDIPQFFRPLAAPALEANLN